MNTQDRTNPQAGGGQKDPPLHNPQPQTPKEVRARVERAALRLRRNTAETIALWRDLALIQQRGWHKDFGFPSFYEYTGRYFGAGNARYVDEHLVIGRLRPRRFLDCVIPVEALAIMAAALGPEAQEVIITATHYAKAEGEDGAPMELAAGDYSLVLLLRPKEGKKMSTQVLTGETYPKAKEDATPYVHDVGGVMDLDGDGKLEILIHSQYYEGGGTSVWKLGKDKAARVLEVECGV